MKQHVQGSLKGLFHPAFLARVVSRFAFVVAIFMGHEFGDKQRLAKRQHVQGMLDETDPLSRHQTAIEGAKTGNEFWYNKKANLGPI